MFNAVFRTKLAALLGTKYKSNTSGLPMPMFSIFPPTGLPISLIITEAGFSARNLVGTLGLHKHLGTPSKILMKT